MPKSGYQCRWQKNRNKKTKWWAIHEIFSCPVEVFLPYRRVRLCRTWRKRMRNPLSVEVALTFKLKKPQPQPDRILPPCPGGFFLAFSSKPSTVETSIPTHFQWDTPIQGLAEHGFRVLEFQVPCGVAFPGQRRLIAEANAFLWLGRVAHAHLQNESF